MDVEPNSEQVAGDGWGDPELFVADLPGGVRPHRVRYWIGVSIEDGTFRLDDHVDDGEVCVGMEVTHLRDDGEWCGGYVSWPNDYGVQPSGHKLISLHPLTLTDSLACKRCPSHGFVTDGHWVGAPD